MGKSEEEISLPPFPTQGRLIMPKQTAIPEVFPDLPPFPSEGRLVLPKAKKPEEFYVPPTAPMAPPGERIIMPDVLRPEPSPELSQERILPLEESIDYSADSRFIEKAYPFLRGLAEEFTLGLAEFPDEWQPKPGVNEALYGVGKFAGFFGPALLYGGKAAQIAVKPLLKKLGTKATSQIAKRVIEGGVALGTASAITDIKDLEGMPERFFHGLMFGSILGATSHLDFHKLAPVTNLLIRQFSSRAMANMANIYEPDALKEVLEGSISGEYSPDLPNKVFDELIFTFFSFKKASPREVLNTLDKINPEIERLNLPIDTWRIRPDGTIQTSAGKIVFLNAFSKTAEDIVKKPAKRPTPKKSYYRFFPKDAPQVWRDVMDVTSGKGIRPFKDLETGKFFEYEEYREAVPKQLKGRRGYPADEVADMLGMEGSKELYEALRWKKREIIEEVPEYVQAAKNEVFMMEADILKGTKRPQREIAEFIDNTFMDGERLREITSEVLEGRKTKLEAVKEVRELIEDTVKPVPEVTAKDIAVRKAQIKERLAEEESPIMRLELKEQVERLEKAEIEAKVEKPVPEVEGRVRDLVEGKTFEQIEEIRKGLTLEEKGVVDRLLKEKREMVGYRVFEKKPYEPTVIRREVEITGFKPRPLSEAEVEAARKAGLVEELPPSERGRKREPGAEYFDLELKGISPGEIESGSLAYGMRLPKYAKSINLERIGADYGVKKYILDLTDMYAKEIRARRRGKISFEESERMANSLGLTVESLMERVREKTESLDAYVTAARDTLNTSAVKVDRLAKEYVLNPTEQNLAKYMVSINKHASIQLEVSGGATEIGRALSVHRRTSKANESLLAGNYKAALKMLGNRRINEELAKAMASLDFRNPSEVSKFINEARDVKTSDKIFEVWVNSLLSGVPTHVVNITSNFMTLAEKPVLTEATALIEATRRVAGKEPRVYLGEVPHEIFAIFQGLPDGVRRAAYAWKNEATMDSISKIEVRRPRAIKGKKGEVIRLPGRALMAADEFFKAILYKMDVHGMAYRKAVSEGLVGKSRVKRIAELIENPTKEMRTHATDEMFYRTFQKLLGKHGKKIGKIREIPAIRYIIPFLRVSINIPKFGLERTPLNLPRIIYKHLRGDFKGRVDPVTMEYAKVGMGTFIAMTTFIMAMKGAITGGGPTDRNERKALYREGWQPYSLKVKDKYYSYARIEPWATMLGIAADMSEIWEQVENGEKDDMAAKLMLAVSQNMTNKTFMRGVSEALNAISDPERHGGRWLKTFASTAVPTGVAYVAKAKDPYFRDARTLTDSIKSRLPLVSETLPPRRDLYGRPVERKGEFIEKMVSPIWISEQKINKIDQEFKRLDYFPGLPGRKIRELDLKPDEYSDFLEVSGRITQNVLSRLISSSAYQEMSNDEKLDAIKLSIIKIRKIARAQFLPKLLRVRARERSR